MRGPGVEGQPAAERPALGHLVAETELLADEMELCRRDARGRRREDEPAPHRVVVQVRVFQRYLWLKW